MSSESDQRHDKEKEKLHEQAQRRCAVTPQSSASENPVAPLFKEPSKVKGSNESNRIKKQMCSILGDYDDFCSTASKSMIRVDRTPPTPQRDSSGRKKDSLFNSD